jgi:hypothetical protein
MKALITWKSLTRLQCAITEVTDFVAMPQTGPCKHVVVKDMGESFPLNTFIATIDATESQKVRKKYKSAKLQENSLDSPQELRDKATLHY